MLVRFDDCEEVESTVNHLVMRSLLKAADSPDLSITWVRLDGAHLALKAERTDRIYYVIEGSGEFRLEGEGDITAGPGDVVLIPKGVAYVFQGSMTYLVMNTPAFQPGDDLPADITLENP